MRSLRLLLGAPIFMAVPTTAMFLETGCCTDCGYYDPDEDDSGVVTTDSGGDDTDSDTQDTNDTQDTDTQDTDTDPVVSGDCHQASPVATGGWTRQYAVTYQGSSGSEVQTGLGNGQIKSELTAGANSWNIVIDYACNAGRWEMMGWEGEVTQTIDTGFFPIPITECVKSTPSSPRPDLPDMATLANTGSWSYNYQMHIEPCDATDTSSQVTPGDVPTSGTFTAWGAEANPNGVTAAYQAFKVTNTFEQKGSSYNGGLGGLSDLNGYTEMHYVKGLGLVKEVTTDVDDPSQVYLSKDLTSYTGLTPAQP